MSSWQRYSLFIRGRLNLLSKLDEGDVNYWRELSFLKIVTYILPITLVALIPRVFFGLQYGYVFVPVFDVAFYLLFCVVLLQKSIPLAIKKTFMLLMFYLLAMVILYMQGANGPGPIYLTCTCILTGFLYKGNKIYYSLLANFIVVLLAGVIIYFKLFNSPLHQQFNPIRWFNYTSSLLFINLMCLLLIQRIIRRLEKIIIIESELQGQLADEALEVKTLTHKLKESEDYYRYLFAANPSPMWVFDTESLRFLQVNDAAMKLYGYSRDEFMEMTIDQIRPAEEVRDLLDMVKISKDNVTSFKGNMVHLKKNQKTFHVEIRSNPIEVNGQMARLVLATDVTERMRYVNSIENQNSRLKHIAWVQSHKVRAPLARVMSLSSLLERVHEEEARDEIVKYLIISADELNEVVTTIIKKAEEE
jgi:PAS domain S-box-containing protein